MPPSIIETRKTCLPVMLHRDTSQFVFIKRCAEAEGWDVGYLDHGIGHDSHLLTHHKRKQVLGVDYLRSRPVSATWNGFDVGVDKIVDILIGVDLPVLNARRAHAQRVCRRCWTCHVGACRK